MQKFCFQYQFEGKGLENNFGPSVKLSDKKIQNGSQNTRCRINPHNFCTIEHKIVILVSMHTFACMNN